MSGCFSSVAVVAVAGAVALSAVVADGGGFDGSEPAAAVVTGACPPVGGACCCGLAAAPEGGGGGGGRSDAGGGVGPAGAAGVVAAVVVLVVAPPAPEFSCTCRSLMSGPRKTRKGWTASCGGTNVKLPLGSSFSRPSVPNERTLCRATVASASLMENNVPSYRMFFFDINEMRLPVRAIHDESGSGNESSKCVCVCEREREREREEDNACRVLVSAGTRWITHRHRSRDGVCQNQHRHRHGHQQPSQVIGMPFHEVFLPMDIFGASVAQRENRTTNPAAAVNTANSRMSFCSDDDAFPPGLQLLCNPFLSLPINGLCAMMEQYCSMLSGWRAKASKQASTTTATTATNKTSSQRRVVSASCRDVCVRFDSAGCLCPFGARLFFPCCSDCATTTPKPYRSTPVRPPVLRFRRTKVSAYLCTFSSGRVTSNRSGGAKPIMYTHTHTHTHTHSLSLSLCLSLSVPLYYHLAAPFSTDTPGVSAPSIVLL